MKYMLFIGAFFCFLAVVAGALGSHALRDILMRMDGLSNFNLATQYLFYHGLGIIAVAILQFLHPQVPFQYAGWLMVVGSVLFQGNLFLISMAGIRTFQFLTPVGGICLMAGWLLLAGLALRIAR
jgi:uncharacterized membrane protein YgdD (TMEM256/DUF423 family)